MIDRFGPDTGLLLIDVQRGVDVLEHWGGPTGRRNNPGAEQAMAEILDAWRTAGRAVYFTMHDSVEPASPLKLALDTGRMKTGFEPRPGEQVITKQVNGAFFGTDLEIRLRRAGVTRLVVVGFFTNMCVETSVRSAGNLSFDTYMCPDACATTNRVGPDGVDHDPELVHQLSVASLNDEFCTTLSVTETLGLLHNDNADRSPAGGNRPLAR